MVQHRVIHGYMSMGVAGMTPEYGYGVCFYR
jgi:hypothetical protein